MFALRRNTNYLRATLLNIVREDVRDEKVLPFQNRLFQLDYVLHRG